MSLVFINTTQESFTHEKSGAIGTWIWEVCRAAMRGGDEPMVISMAGHGEPYPWKNAIFLDYPKKDFDIGWQRVLRKAYVMQSQRGGWYHMRHPAWCKRVGDAIERAGLQNMPLALHNDLQLAVILRRRFPNAFILHLAHNQNHCHERFRRYFGSSVNVAVAVSDYTARWNQDYFGVEVKTVVNGVDCEAFYPAAEPPRGVPVLNFVGRTVRDKAPDLLLRAALKLTEWTTDFAVQIVGATHLDGKNQWDTYQTELSSIIQDLERKGVKVSKPGFVSRKRMGDELRKVHIHVIPSRWEEPCSLSLLEGMACGLPTVASSVGGMPQVLGESGFLFERDSVDGLAEILRRLVTDEALRREYGVKARARAKQWTWDRTWEQIKGLLPAEKNCEIAALPTL